MSKSNLLKKNNPNPLERMDAAAREQWGRGISEEEKEGLQRVKKERIELIPLDTILPDPRQPRRAIPWQVRQHSNELVEMFQFWLSLMGQPYENILNSEDDLSLIPVQQALIDLVQLAQSIDREGLTNPITVVRQDEHYLLETGERRWLAYQWLRLMESREGYESIPARIVEHLDVWRQASENGARQNLNAIGRARQYALLMMDLNRDEISFIPYEECEHDLYFYAQSKDLRVPSGYGQTILSAMGITSRSRLSHLRQYLGMPAELWIQADDENWSDAKLFNALNNSKSKRPTPSDVVTKFSTFLAEKKQVYSKYSRRFKKVGEGERLQLEDLIDRDIAELEALKKSLKGK